MKAGRELDALVAEKVMGWHKDTQYGGIWIGPDGGGVNARYEAATDEFGWVTIPVWSPSTSIAAAWEVVEKLKAQGRLVYVIFCLGRWECTIPKDDEGCLIDNGPRADTAPLAICLAALKAVGAEVPDRES